MGHETGEERHGTGNGRWDTGQDTVQEMGQEMGQETGDRRHGTGDVRQETGDKTILKNAN